MILVQTMVDEYTDKIANNSDETLLRQFKGGDNNAFHTIFYRYEKFLLNYLFGLTANLELSKDVCQETFLQLINHPPVMLFGRKLKPWLFRTAHNKAMDLLRRAQKQQPLGKIETDRIESSGNPEKIMIEKDEFEQVRSQLENVPEIYREVVSLHIFGELTFKEIAKIMRIPLGTALWRMQKALDLMRESYKKEGHDHEK